MPKRTWEDTQDYPTFDLIVNGNHYTVEDVIDWNPIQLTCSLNPEEVSYMIKFTCYFDDVIVRCRDEEEQDGVMACLAQLH